MTADRSGIAIFYINVIKLEKKHKITEIRKNL